MDRASLQPQRKFVVIFRFGGFLTSDLLGRFADDCCGNVLGLKEVETLSGNIPADFKAAVTFSVFQCHDIHNGPNSLGILFPLDKNRKGESLLIDMLESAADIIVKFLQSRDHDSIPAHSGNDLGHRMRKIRKGF